jgi:RNA polymerase sigma factor (TIGR02999 family)
MSQAGEITALLREIGDGEASVVDRLFPLIYGELQHLARAHRHGWRDQLALGTKSLVHEAYLKLVQQEQVDWRGRLQFFSLASKAMRSILVDNARRFARQKREGARRQVPLTDDLLVSEARSDEIVELDAALERLGRTESRLARVVECRVFGGLGIDETAEIIGASPATVKRDWALARAWLYRELKEGLPP